MTTIVNNLPYTFTATPPGLKDLLDLLKQDLMINFSCHHIGTIVSFNPLNQTATASINYQKTFFKTDPITQQVVSYPVPYPILVDCPCVVLQGGTTALTMPIQTGDECLILFNDRDIDNWFAGSSTAPVATTRLHSTADALILVGLSSLPLSIKSYDVNRAVLRAGEVSGTIAAVGVNELTSKVLITNTYPANTVTLNTLLQQLITDLNTLITTMTTNAAAFIAVTGAPGTPSPLNPVIVTSLISVNTSLTALATQIAGVLE